MRGASPALKAMRGDTSKPKPAHPCRSCCAVLDARNGRDYALPCVASTGSGSSPGACPSGPLRSGAQTRKTAGGWKMSLHSLGQLNASIHETHELSPQQQEALLRLVSELKRPWPTYRPPPKRLLQAVRARQPQVQAPIQLPAIGATIGAPSSLPLSLTNSTSLNTGCVSGRMPVQRMSRAVSTMTKTQEVMTGADRQSWPGGSGAFLRVIRGLGRPDHDLQRLIRVG